MTEKIQELKAKVSVDQHLALSSCIFSVMVISFVVIVGLVPRLTAWSAACDTISGLSIKKGFVLFLRFWPAYAMSSQLYEWRL